jgi:hypothetical protein
MGLLYFLSVVNTAFMRNYYVPFRIERLESWLEKCRDCRRYSSCFDWTSLNAENNLTRLLWPLSFSQSFPFNSLQ